MIKGLFILKVNRSHLDIMGDTLFNILQPDYVY